MEMYEKIDLIDARTSYYNKPRYSEQVHNTFFVHYIECLVNPQNGS